MSLQYLSVCSGIEAATQAWAHLGWKATAYSEIEPFPCAVLAHHYPETPNWGDMTKFKDWPDANVDVLCGGTPCQSFSVAGLRQGLADPRGNLMLTYLAIASKYRPRWLVWENVPGVYSANSHNAPDTCPPNIDLDASDGPEDGQEVVVEDSYDSDEDHAFACFLAGLQELGYGFSYRTIDAQHVRTRRFPLAVPQRRRRVFVVGYLGDWRRAAAVLFDRESLSGHPAPRRKAGQGFARGIEFGPSGGGFADVNPTLDTRAKDGPIRNQLAGAVLCASVAPTLNANFGDKQGLENQHINGGGGLFVSFRIAGDGCAYEEGEVTAPLTTGTDPSASVIAQPWAVRRLTPRECERLQGFPDDFTRIPYRKKTADLCPDGPRYKSIGNSWAVNCAEWIGERINEVEGWPQ